MEVLGKQISKSVEKIYQRVIDLGWEVSEEYHKDSKIKSARIVYSSNEYRNEIKKAKIFLPDNDFFEVKYAHELCHIIIDEQLHICDLKIEITDNSYEKINIIESILTDGKVYDLLSQYKVDTSADLLEKYKEKMKTIINISSNNRLNLKEPNHLEGLLDITVNYIVLKNEWKSKLKQKLTRTIFGQQIWPYILKISNIVLKKEIKTKKDYVDRINNIIKILKLETKIKVKFY